MIITTKYIKDLREKAFMNISEDMEELILQKFGEYPEDENGYKHEYTEQDVFEQIRKMIR